MGQKSPPFDPPTLPHEFEPFVPGREVRTFSQTQWVNLMSGIKPAIRPRTQRAARMVLVDKMPYKLAAIACDETQAMVRGACQAVMERFGLLGGAWYNHNPDHTLVLRDIPPQYHGQVRDVVDRLRLTWVPRTRPLAESIPDAGWSK